MGNSVKKAPLDAEFLLCRLMEHSSDSIYFKDRKSHFIMVNKTCAKKHGLDSEQDIIGGTDFDVFTKEHAEKACADERQIMRTGEPLFGIEEKETWPDGSMAWASSSKMPLKNAEGEIVGTFGMSRDITGRKKAELRSRRGAEQVRLIKEEMEEEIRMAGELQKAFFRGIYPVFPEGSSPEKSCVEFLHQFRSCSDVSGDYCSVSRLSDTEAGIFLCDVQGIGVRAALGTALVRGIMQEIAPLGLEPGPYLTRMNQLLHPLLNQDEILLDVKACYLVLEVSSGTLRIATAGHPMPIHLQGGGSAKWLFEREDLSSIALAGQADSSYQTIECSIDPGDGLVLFTDGLYSAANTEGTFCDPQRLLASAGNHAGEPLSTLLQSLEADARACSADGTFSDDVCMVGFKLKQLLGEYENGPL